MRRVLQAWVQTPCRNTTSNRRIVDSTIRHASSDANPPTQPFKGFAIDTLDAPLHSLVSRTRTQPAPPPAEDLPKTRDEEKLAKARVVFGSRLAGPAERQKAKEDAGKMIAGVLVPPKPEEPDNCCMSGCVNCVWDLFRDDMEEWAAKSAEARSRMAEEKEGSGQRGDVAGQKGLAGGVADEDGMGSGFGMAGDGDLFEGIPIGIREFMKTEKKLKERHAREGSLGG